MSRTCGPSSRGSRALWSSTPTIPCAPRSRSGSRQPRSPPVIRAKRNSCALSRGFPLITYKGDEITPREGGYTVVGELTLRGVTRRLEIPFDFHGVVSDPWGLRAGFSSEFTVERRDFGITWDRIFDWGLMAGHELTFSLEIELAYPDESLAQAPQQVE